jgi:hypothetical protein
LTCQGLRKRHRAGVFGRAGCCSRCLKEFTGERANTMKHADFQIGTEFFTAAGRWRCTDVGTRVIVAISLEPRETVRLVWQSRCLTNTIWMVVPLTPMIFSDGGRDNICLSLLY